MASRQRESFKRRSALWTAEQWEVFYEKQRARQRLAYQRKRLEADESDGLAKLDAAAASIDRDSRQEVLSASSYAFNRADTEAEYPDSDYGDVSLTNERMRRSRARKSPGNLSATGALRLYGLVTR